MSNASIPDRDASTPDRDASVTLLRHASSQVRASRDASDASFSISSRNTRAYAHKSPTEKSDEASRPQALYRFYNTAGHLLYIGITADPGIRWKTHSKTKPWWTDVTRVTVEHHADRATVAAAETAAIKAEHPRHNATHNHHPTPAITAPSSPPQRSRTPRTNELTPAQVCQIERRLAIPGYIGPFL